jgi:hypothetical protein
MEWVREMEVGPVYTLGFVLPGLAESMVVLAIGKWLILDRRPPSELLRATP